MADVGCDNFPYSLSYPRNIVADDAEKRLAVAMGNQLSVFAHINLYNEIT